jgi:hypothetical protein
MIDVETINQKCLIALQALQDIMNEFESLPKEFSDYLRDIEAWETNWRVSEYLHELKALPLQGNVKNIFISNDEEVAPKSLWFFLDGYCLAVKNFLEERTAPKDIQMTSLTGKAESVNIKKQNFNIDTESPIPNEPLQSKLQITVELKNDWILALSAVDVSNCVHLLGIYRRYFEPLFPI